MHGQKNIKKTKGCRLTQVTAFSQLFGWLAPF